MSEHHHHAPVQYGKVFAIGIALNLIFVGVEAFYGWQADSLALLADAGHNLSDVGGLLLAWVAYGAAKLKPNATHTFGWRKGSILASFVNAIILLVAMGSLGWEAIGRLHSPSIVDSKVVIIVAAIGIVINSITAWLFVSGSKKDLNIRGAFIHMAADAIVSLGVVIAGILSLWKGWSWVDPVTSLLIALVIIIGTWSLFRQSLHLLFDGVPTGIELKSVSDSLKNLPGVVGLHDLHIWAISTTQVALSVHLVMEDSNKSNDSILKKAIDLLDKKFHIEHATIQLESPVYAQTCELNYSEIKINHGLASKSK